jgi:hypothetical protein
VFSDEAGWISCDGQGVYPGRNPTIQAGPRPSTSVVGPQLNTCDMLKFKLGSIYYVLNLLACKYCKDLQNYWFKGIVQRDLTGVETRLKRSVLMNYTVAKFAFLILKEHHHKRSIKLVSAS